MCVCPSSASMLVERQGQVPVDQCRGRHLDQPPGHVGQPAPGGRSGLPAAKHEHVAMGTRRDRARDWISIPSSTPRNDGSRVIDSYQFSVLDTEDPSLLVNVTLIPLHPLRVAFADAIAVVIRGAVSGGRRVFVSSRRTPP